MAALTCAVVIPARGGSKGIPGKNLRPVGGRSLIWRAVAAARAARSASVVAVSTDDEAIAAEARLAGALVIERPAAIAGDTASSESAVLHALEVLETQGPLPPVTVLMQCTSPFTRGEEVDRVVAALEHPGAACALSVVEDHGFLWGLDAQGFAAGVNHDHTQPRRRRQELPPQYRENGALYAMRTEQFRAVGNRFCGPAVPVPLSTPPVEIDDERDLALCDAVATVLDAPLTPDLSRIRVVVTDFDGVHTDDTVSVDQDGREAVRCSRADGMGVEMLRRAGFPVLILSKERNPVVAARAAKLRVECLQGIEDKRTALSDWLAAHGASWEQVAYLGNDVNDAACLAAAGLAVVPSDAHPAVRPGALVLPRPGGHGAVRALADLLLASRTG
jgi:N-acylneuraminate cytidylyltransferase